MVAVGPLSDNVSGDQFVAFYLPEGLRPPREDLPEVLAKAHMGRWLETLLLIGLCLLISRDTLNAYGLLDEACELGADDLELAWRLRRLGLQLRIATAAFVFHIGSASFDTLPSPERTERVARSDAALADKLMAFHTQYPVPSSQTIWGCAVFEEALTKS